MSKLTAVFAVVALAIPTVVHAETFTHEKSGLTFWLPDDWKTSQDGEVLTATDPAESIGLVFAITDATDVEGFMNGLDEELGDFIKRPKITNGPDTETVNGLIHAYVEGTGRIEGEEMDWDLTVVFGGTKALVMLGMGEIDKNQKIVDKIYGSVEKAAGRSRRGR